ncbi:MAG: porin [Parvibaculales bacterium]
MTKLLSTTSLARAAVIGKGGLLAALPLTLLACASAQAGPVDLTVGGFFVQSVAAVDADSDTDNLEDEGIVQNAEIHFKGKAILDGGTEIGLNIQLEAETSSDQIDEHYVYAKGDWGKLIVGAENGVAHLGEVTAPGFVAGLKMHDNSLTDAVIEKAYDVALGANAIEDANMSTKIEHISSDANKVSYFTPRLNGLQLGVSFAPNNEDADGGESNFEVIEAGTQEDIIEFSVNYKMRMMNGTRVKLGYTQVEGSTVGGGADPESYGYGVQIAYDNYVFGANQTTYENLRAIPADSEVDEEYAGSIEIETTNIAAAYKIGATKFGIGFTDSEEILEAGGKVDYEELMIGGSTKLADGVSVGYYYQDTEASLNNTSADVSLIGLTLALKF